jgi:hypothetical protein
MVEDSRTSPRPAGLRPLNRPRPVTILTGDGLPVLLIEGERRRQVRHIQDSWHVDDEWWREPIHRRYYRLALDDGVVRTVYHDVVGDNWFEQEY